MSKASKIIATGLVIAGNVVAQGESLVAHNQLLNQQNKTKSELFVNFSNPTSNESTFYLDGIISPSNQVPSKYTGIYAGFETNPESLDWNEIYNVSLSEIPPEILKYGMLRKLNEIRKEHGLKPLKYDKKLEKVAQDFAYDREQNGPKKLSHIDSKGGRPDDRIEEAGLLGTYVQKIYKDGIVEGIGENLATFSGYNINTVYDAWMNSPGHRRNIVSPYLTSIGFGLTQQGNTIVCLFANVVK